MKRSSHNYDNIFKENLEKLVLPLLQRQMGITIYKSEPLGTEFNATTKRGVDYLKKITTQGGEAFILHLEYQSTYDSEMLYRVGEYHGMIQRRHPGIEIRHFVIYFGKQKIKMERILPEPLVYRGFQLIDLQAMDSSDFIRSDIPEEILLAVLADFKGEPPEAIIRLIIKRLREVSTNDNELQKCFNQLNLLSQARNLDVLTAKTIQEMPFTIDITQNYWYKQVKKEAEEVGMREGMEKGIKEGIKEGAKEGRAKGRYELKLSKIVSTQKMLAKGFDVETICDLLSVSESFVEDVIAEKAPEEIKLVINNDETIDNDQ
ncbi:MAG: hypothetical protein MI974_06930 [Chitinophagales bacterium]|nr:hypothetical protein [Chitinophagales bacterium]